MSSKFDTIKGLLIDPEAQTIAEVEVRKDNSAESYLDHICRLLNCQRVDVGRDGLLFLPSSPFDDIWFDDEFVFCDSEYTWELPMWIPVAGKGLILYYDNLGNSVSHTLTPEDIDVLRSTIVWGKRNGKKTPADASRGAANE